MSGKILKNRIARRTLSMILAISMLMSALPTFAFAIKGDTPRSLYYNLKKAYTGDQSMTYVSTVTYDMTSGESALNPEMESDAWAYQGRTDAKTGGYWKYNGTAYGLAMYAGKTGAFGITGNIKVKVPVGGKYIPQVEVHGLTGVNLLENENSAISTFQLCAYDAGSDTVGEVLASRDVNTALYKAGDFIPLSGEAIELAAGEYVFKTATNIGLSCVDSFKLALADTATASELVIDNNAGLVTVKEGADASVPVAVTMSDGSEADLSKLTADITFSAADIASASYADGKISFTGIKAGKTTATVKIGEAMARVNVNVLEPDAADETARTYTYDFKKSFQTRLTKFDTATYAANTPGAYGEVTTSVASDPWAFAEAATSGYFQYNYPTNGLILYDAGYGMLKIKVPQSGVYLPKVTLGKTSTGTVKVSLLSSDKTELISKSFNEGTNGLLQISDDGIALQAGEYYVKIAQEVAKKLAYTENFVLEYQSAITTLNVSADSAKTVEVGKDVELPLTVTKTNGDAVAFKDLQISVTYSTADIASAIASTTDTDAKVTFTGLKKGTTKATITVKSGLLSAQTEVNLTVIDEQATAAKSLYYNLKKAYTKDHGYAYPATITYEMTSGESALNADIQSDAWAFQSTTVAQSGSNYFKYNGGNYALALNGATFNYNPIHAGNIKVRVPFAGKYIPQVNVYGLASGALGTFRFAKYDASTDTIGEVLASREINTAMHVPNSVLSISDQALELEAGEYVFTVADSAGLVIVDGFGLALADTATVSDMTVNNSEGIITIKAGTSKEIPLSVKMSDGSTPDMAALSATTTFSTEHIASVNLTDGKLMVSGTKAGKTTATITIGSATARVNIVVLAEDAADEAARTYSYNFKKPYITKQDMYQYPTHLTYAANTTGAYGELNPAVVSDPWAFDSTTAAGGNNYFKYNGKDYGLALASAGSATLKIKVPCAGQYMPKINLYSATSAEATVSLLDSSKTVVASKTIPAGSNGLQAIADTGITLAADEYFIEVKTAETKKLVIIDGFELEYLGEAVSLQVSADSAKTVEVDQNVDLPLTISMSNNEAIDFNNVSASVTFDSADIASAIAVVNDLGAKITFTGLKAGSTKATITVQYGEYVKAVDTNITVTPKSTPDTAHSLYYDLKKAYTDAAKANYTYVDTITYAMTSGESALNSDIKSDPWAFQSRSAKTSETTNDYWRYNGNGYGLAMNGSSTNDIKPVYEGNLKFKVEHAGKYIPQVNIFGLASGSFGTFSISKYDAGTNTIGEVLASREINTAMYTPNSVISLSSEALDLTAGEYVFTMKTNAGLIIVDGFGLEIADTATVSEIILNNDEGIVKVKEGAAAEVPFAVKMSDGSTADLKTLAAETTFSTADIASAATASGKIKFTGLSVGTTTATVKIGSAMARINVSVIAAETPDEKARDYTYNFKKPYIKPRNAYNYPLTLTYAANTAGAYGEINPKIASDSWAFDSQAIDPNGYFKYNSDGYGLALYHPGSGTLKIKVLADGKYLPKVNIHSATGADTTISLLKGEEVLASKTIPVGTTGIQPIADAGIALTAGEYLVKIEHATKGKLAIVDAFLLQDVGSAPEIQLAFNELLVNAKVGATAELPLLLSMSDNQTPVDYSKLSIKVSFDPENIASAEPQKDDSSAKVAFTGLAEGITTATIEVSNGISSAKQNINVRVTNSGSSEETARDLHYDFMKGWQGVVDYDNAKGITYAMTTQYSAQEINKDRVSDPWAYYSYEPIGSADANFYFRYNTKDYGLALSRPGIGSMKIKVPVTGKYMPQATLHTATSHPTTISLYKLNGDVLGDKVAEKEITVNGTKDYDIADSAITLEAGEYVVSMKITGSKCLAIINGFKLIESSKAQIQASADGLVSVEEGADATLPLTLSMSDGSPVSYKDLAISVDFETADIASAVAIKNDNEAKVTFTGLKEGTTKATVTISDSQSSAKVELNVSVTAKGAADTVRDLFYNIKKAWIGNTSADYPSTITYSMMTKGAINEVNPGVVSEPWEFLSTTSTGGNNYFKFNSKDYGLCKSQIGAGSIKIKVPVSGNYQPVAVLYTASDAPVTMTLFKYDAENNAAGEKLAEREKITVTDTGDYALIDDQIPLEAGEYVVTISHSKTPGLGIIDGFKLINLDKKLAISAPALSVVKGESAKTTITVKDYEGNIIPASDLTYKMTVADNTIAETSIAVENDAVVVSANGLKLGSTTATIQFSTADGKNGEFKLPITTTADFDLKIDMNIPDKVKVGEEISVPVSVRYIRNGADDGDAPAEITTAVTNPALSTSVLPGEGQIGNTLKLNGTASGTVVLTVTVKVSEVIKTFKYAMLVYNTTGNTTKNYQFKIQKGIPEKTEISKVDSYFKTMAGSGEQLRPNAETDTWCYAGQSENTTFINNYDSYGSALEMDTGSWGAIKVRLPESGIYQLVSQNALYPMAGIMRVYIAPADAENPRDPKYSLGSKDTFMEGTKNDIIPVHYTNLRTVELEAGDYIVTWENIGRNSGCIAPAARLYIGGILFNAVDALPEITLKAGEISDIRQYSTLQIPLTATVSDGSAEDIYGAEFEVTPSVSGIADVKTVTENGKTMLAVTGVGVGTTNLAVSMKIHGTVRASINIPITVTEPGKLTRVSVGVLGSDLNTISLHELDEEKNQAQLEVHIFDENDVEIPTESAEIQHVSYSYASEDESIASVDQTGHVIAYNPGKVKVLVTVSMSGITKVGEAILNVTLGKTRSSYYTEEKVANVRENAELYPWARATKEAYMKRADKYVGEEERLWNLFTTQELPRSYYVGYRGDPEAAKCRYCGCDIAAKYGSMYGWLYNAWEDPWKVQCPDCRRKFPSNDFGSFYELGIDEQGNWRYELAKEKNAELVANGQDGYLKNVLYPEMGEGWGVDDGYGYDTGRVYANGCEEVHTYISFYNYWALYSGLIYPAVTDLEMAYVYSGETKYGRALAIMMDRLADLYPDYDAKPYQDQFTVGKWYDPHGKFTDLIWENQYAQEWSRAYDAAFPMYEDPYVINFLSEKAAKYNMSNDKSTARLIRTNCEDGILREIFRSAKIGNIYGNFGMHQCSVSLAAVALDTMPETREMIDWVFQNGEGIGSPQANVVTGGDVLRHIINEVDRNGVSNEISPGYSAIWSNGLSRVLDALAGYDGYAEMDLWKNPRFLQLYKYQGDIMLSRRSFPAIGDTGATAMNKIEVSATRMLECYENTGDPYFAQMAYFLNGNSADGLRYSPYKKNPESAKQDVQRVIEEYGEYNFDRSLQLPGYGFAALRSGSLYQLSGNKSVDTQRTFWMFYGRGAGHGHMDSLNLGIEAMGLNIAPDLGYPRNTTADDYYNWGHATVAHNTVVVNDKSQNRIRTTGVPMHFDDSGRVKIMDADTAHQYNIDQYRRTVVSIDVDNEFSYGIDFFRVKGGNEHVYSFHALSDTISESEGLGTLTPQVDGSGNYVGSYAGPNVPFKTEKVSSGYSYLRNVDRSGKIAGGNFMVDFKITDFRDQVENEGDMHLRMTMLNGFDLSEVAITNGDPPPRDDNPETLKYVLARRSGSNLDSLFTTVFEPYEDNRYIASIENVSNVVHADGSALEANEVVRAIKVTLTNGRNDYIVYAADNSIEYRVDDLFNIRGFVGVYTVQDGENVYSYVNDGDIIGEAHGFGAVTGNVVDFTKGLEFENSITVSLNESIDPQTLVGQYIYVDKVGSGNAAYEILGAEGSGSQAVLDLGSISLIDSVADNGSYLYNIAEGQTFRIPLSTLEDASPKFDPIGEKSVEAKSQLEFFVNAISPIDRPVTYQALDLPRGANFDAETGKFTWIPDGSQVGIHHVAIEASNEVFESTLNFTIRVYNETGGDSPNSGTTTPGGTEKPGEDDKPPVVTVEEDEVKFAASTEETTADTKLGSVTFPDGTFAEDGQGTLKIKKENEKFNISVSATVDMEEKPAKVSLNYTPADNMTDKNCIVVKDANGNIIPNGKYADGKMTFYTDTFGDFTIVYNPKSFTDLGNHAWANEAITRLAARGIINGITATTYGPARNITRADFTTLIVRAFGFEGEAASFADVPANAYYAEPVGIAKTLGIVGGVNESDFAPTAEITRQDMMVIVARALDKAGYVLHASESPAFSDTAEVADYAKDAVQMLTASGIIAGSNGKINPKGKTTRAEVAVILDRIVFMAR